MASDATRSGTRRRFRSRLQGASVVSDLLQHLRRVTDDLDRHNACFAIVGGMAISLRTEPRFTRDLDIAIAVKSDDEAESLGRTLTTEGYRILAQVEQEAVDRLATLRLALPESVSVVIDLLFASCGIEPEIVEHAERLEALPGWVAPVARAEHLLAMKLLASDTASRPQDLVDAGALLRTMTAEDIERARDAVQLIEQRGFNRRKNLNDELNRLLHSSKGGDGAR